MSNLYLLRFAAIVKTLYIFIVVIVKSEIINESIIKNLIIPSGNFTQFRISGFGIGDEGLDDDLARVTIEMKFNSTFEPYWSGWFDHQLNDIKVDEALSKNLHKEKLKTTQRLKSFDLMVFSNNEDYICYIEAVNLL